MVKHLSTAASLMMALWGCSPEAPPPPREAGGVVTSLREIAGQWDIASFKGYTPARLHEGIRRAYVDIGPNGLSYAIECNYSGNPAEIDGSGILHDKSDGSRLQTLMGCGPEGEAREAAFFGFFNSKPKVAWIGDGRIRMSSGKTELILERPERRRLAHIPPLREITGRWVPQMATRLMGGSGHSGWGFQQPGVVAITSSALRYSGCGGAEFTFRYTAEARMEIVAERGQPDCGRDTPGAMLLRVLRKGPLVERMAGGGIALTAGNEVITLRSEELLRRLAENPPPPPPVDYTPPAPPPPPPRRAR